MKSDHDLHVTVLDALEFEPQVKHQRIGIAVKNGVVTLRGEVESLVEKVAAERVVRDVHGVRGLVEELQVNPPGHHVRTDEELADAALNALKWSTLVPAEKLQVKVEHGWITLTGEVYWNFERQEADAAVRPLTGVRGLTNKIKITPHVAPKEVKDKILRAFERNAKREAMDVTVKVDGSIVTLEGTIQNWTEYEEAEKMAWSAPGVTAVKNCLVVNVRKDKAVIGQAKIV